MSGRNELVEQVLRGTLGGIGVIACLATALAGGMILCGVFSLIVWSIR